MAAPLFDGTKPQFAQLFDACPIVPGATVSKPLVALPEGRVVIFSMDAGQEISEHRSAFAATVHVLDGRLRFGIGGEEREMAAQDWLIMPPNAEHRLTALEPTRFVLTLLKGGEA
jgi:quercetin dioxygenase-like cupin family protein